MKGKGIGLGLLLLALSALTLRGQNEASAAVDSTLYGQSIFNVLPSVSKGGKADVRVTQTKTLQEMLSRQIASNGSRNVTCYRVRIFNDNSQTARAASEAVLASFKAAYAYPAYRSYTNPFFKVTVGDFRTKSEAMQLMSRIISEYPTAFVVKEPIHYPVVDKENTYYVDTVKVYKPIVKE